MTRDENPSDGPETNDPLAITLRTRYVPAPATDYYTRIGIGIVSGLGLVALIALLNPGGLGLFELGTSMTMIGAAFVVGFAGLLVTLFILRSTLRSIDARAEYLAAESLRKASERENIWAPMALVDQHQRALDDLSEFGSRQATAVAGLQAASRDHAGSLERLGRDVAEIASWRADAGRLLAELRAAGSKSLGDLQAEFAAFKASTANDAKRRDEAVEKLRAEQARQDASLGRLAEELANAVQERDEFLGEIRTEAARHSDAIATASKELAAVAARDEVLASEHAETMRRIEAHETQNTQALEALAASDAALAARHGEAAVAFANHEADQDAAAKTFDERLAALAGSVEAVAGDAAALHPLALKALHRIDEESKERRVAVADIEDRVTDLSAREDDVYQRQQHLAGRLQAHEERQAASEEQTSADISKGRQLHSGLRRDVDAVTQDHARAIGRLAVGLGRSYAKGCKADVAAGARIEALVAFKRDEAEAIKKLAQGMDALATRWQESEKQLAAQSRSVDAVRKRLANRIGALRNEQRAELHRIEAEEARQQEELTALAKKESAAEARLADEAHKRQEAVKGLRAQGARMAARLGQDEKAFEARQAEAAARTQEMRKAIQADVDTLAAEEARLDRRIEAGHRARRRAVDVMRAQEAEIAKRVTRNERAIRSAVTRLEAERLRLDAIMKRILEEERQRKREFEALASEEMRIMGRVLKRNEANGRAREEASSQYWVARPKSKEKGPFGLVYRLNQVEGLTAAAARKLRKLDIRDTEDLWRADPAFLADYLGVGRETVELWQEEAELMAIDGIGGHTAEALAQAGVTSIEKLGAEEPDHLVRIVSKTNGSTPVSRRNAQKWIKAARKYAPAK